MNKFEATGLLAVCWTVGLIIGAAILDMICMSYFDINHRSTARDKKINKYLKQTVKWGFIGGGISLISGLLFVMVLTLMNVIEKF